jgi:dihydrofolate reductase
MGKIAVHEFVSLDGVFENPSWTFDYGFTDGMSRAIGALTDASSAILLGRTTYQAFAPAWSDRTAEDDPGAPFFNDTPKYVVSSTLGSPTTGRTRPSSGPTTRRPFARSRTRSATSTSAAAAPWCGRC